MRVFLTTLWADCRNAFVVSLLVTSVTLNVLTACGGNIVVTTESNVENAARLTAASFAHQDAGTAGAALIREAHCDLQAVIHDQKFAPVDSGIGCQ